MLVGHDTGSFDITPVIPHAIANFSKFRHTNLMHDLNPLWLNSVVALGIGLLIGAERERNKGSGPDRSPAGIRIFCHCCHVGRCQHYAL